MQMKVYLEKVVLTFLEMVINQISYLNNKIIIDFITMKICLKRREILDCKIN